jgi:hypothetical protein
MLRVEILVDGGVTISGGLAAKFGPVIGSQFFTFQGAELWLDQYNSETGYIPV